MDLAAGAQLRDHRQAVALGQHAVDDEHVELVVERERKTLLAVARHLGHMAGFAQRLFQVVGGVAVVLDDKQAHGGGSGGGIDGGRSQQAILAVCRKKGRAEGFCKPPARGTSGGRRGRRGCRRRFPSC